MRNKKRRILVAAMAAVLVLTLSAGLMLPAAEGNRTGNAYAAANQWNPAVDDSDSGEPIPGQYIVKKKNGDIELVKTNKGIEELKKDIADKVKISDICKKYGITKPTFYRYKENRK